MNYSVRESFDRIIVELPNDRMLNESRETSQGLRRICDHATATPKRLIIDFSKVEYMSSEMLQMLLNINNYAAQRSLDFRFSNVSPIIHEMFSLTRLEKIFRFDDGENDEGDGLSLNC